MMVGGMNIEPGMFFHVESSAGLSCTRTPTAEGNDHYYDRVHGIVLILNCERCDWLNFWYLGTVRIQMLLSDGTIGYSFFSAQGGDWPPLNWYFKEVK